VQVSERAEHIKRDLVEYHFLPGDSQCHALLRRLNPDVFHVHGLDSPRQVAALCAAIPEPPIILQDHASGVPRVWRRAAMRRGLRAASGVAFCALTQAKPFKDAGLIAADTPIYEIPESTTRFAMGDQCEARRVTAVTGNPAVLWVGHLDVNKDPLTVLQGISDAARVLPDLTLYCCFGNAPLLQAVRRRVEADPLLRSRVQLLGCVPHDRVELLMRAADIFVLGSHREGSGYSLIEAMACGLSPVVTDIPSFRSLTGAASVGRLWACGDAPGLSKALLAVAHEAAASRSRVRAHFERSLSFHALSAKLSAMYDDAIARRLAA
jgi:glycosyltransferase involved in cell wall biosynthesis